jgi:hypothetical protein
VENKQSRKNCQQQKLFLLGVVGNNCKNRKKMKDDEALGFLHPKNDKKRVFWLYSAESNLSMPFKFKSVCASEILVANC